MSGISVESHVVIWQRNHEILRVEPWGRDGLRVHVTRNAALRDDLPGALLPQPPGAPQVAVSEAGATLVNGAIAVEVSADKGALRFWNVNTGEIVLEELQPQSDFIGPAAREFRPLEGDLYRIEARFTAYDDEHLYGLGQQQHGRLDQKGCVVDLQQRNTMVSIPFLLSSRGYGFLWNHPGLGRVELGYSATRWIADAARQLDFWITVGETPAAILDNYTAVTGRAPLLPGWASGFWQCKLRYKTQEELLEIAREYRRRGLPLSVIVSDFFHWTHQGDWKFDPTCWPDPRAMTQELADLGVRLMVSVWPSVSAHSENFEAMQRDGLLIRTRRGVEAHMPFIDTEPDGRVYIHYYDATHPAARQFIWDRVRENYYRLGVKVWWLDACEPEIHPYDPDNLLFHIGAGSEVANIYPMYNQQAFYEGMRAEGEDEIVTLCRSGWAGSQRYAAAIWSGDIACTFESLQLQVRAGLNIGLSGIPWWTTDIGGFHGGDPSTPYFRELIVRWFEYGAFCPLFRLHGVREPQSGGSGAPNEVWSFGDEVYAILREYMFLRERLRPYVMAQMRLAHETGVPPMRPLFFDFPDDPACWAVDDDYMFGPDLLVAPVLEEGATTREVYLPEGASWTNAWTGTVYTGGQVVEVPAPLERIPLFLRDGASLPIKG